VQGKDYFWKCLPKHYTLKGNLQKLLDLKLSIQNLNVLSGTTTSQENMLHVQQVGKASQSTLVKEQQARTFGNKIAAIEHCKILEVQCVSQ
jgi:hypothetical protein